MEQELFLLAGAICRENKSFDVNSIGVWEKIDDAWRGIKNIIGLFSGAKSHHKYGLWRVKLNKAINDETLIVFLTYDGGAWLLKWYDKKFYEKYKGLYGNFINYNGNLIQVSIREIGPE